MLFASFAVYYSVEQTHDTANVLCIAQNRQNAYILAAIQRSKRSLPTISYYKAHPDELKAALKNIKQEEHDFRQMDCNA